MFYIKVLVWYFLGETEQRCCHNTEDSTAGVWAKGYEPGETEQCHNTEDSTFGVWAKGYEPGETEQRHNTEDSTASVWAKGMSLERQNSATTVKTVQQVFGLKI